MIRTIVCFGDSNTHGADPAVVGRMGRDVRWPRVMARDLGEEPSLSDLIGGVKTMLDAYEEGRIDRLFLVSNEFVNTMTQNPTVEQLLPLQAKDDDGCENCWRVRIPGLRAGESERLLAERGVPPDRMSAVSFGEFQTVAPNDTPEGRARNRRVELHIIQP